MSGHFMIIRFYEDEIFVPEVIKTGLTRVEAHQWCESSEASSTTATEPENRARTTNFGAWHDEYARTDSTRAPWIGQFIEGV